MIASNPAFLARCARPLRTTLPGRAAVLALALVSALPTLARADITPDAQTVVERLVQATGGHMALDAVRTLHFRGTVNGLGLSGTQESWARRPDRSREAIALGPFKLGGGFDGTSGWRIGPDGKLAMLDGKDLEEAKASTYFENSGWLAPDQGGGKVALAGTEHDSTGTYTVLEVTPPVGRSRRFWINQSTGLTDRVVTKSDQQTVVTTLSDYRPVEGRLLPHKSVTSVVGMPLNTLTATVDSVWVNETMADALFAPPATEASAIRYLKRPGVARLPFHYRARHVWLTASVNGGPPADFIFDTGASLTVIDSAYAAEIGLKTEGAMQAQGAGSAGHASFSKLETLRVAADDGDGVELADRRVGVLSVNAFLAPFFWRDCAGVIGYDFIHEFVTEVDYDHQMLTLYDPKTFAYQGAGARVPITLAGTVPVVKMKLDDQYEGEFRLDVGSNSTVDLHGPFVKQNDIRPAKYLTVSGGGFGGMFQSRLCRMKRVQLGPFSWPQPIVSLSGAQTGALASEDYAGNVGNQILERFKCTFDYERRALYLEPGAKLKKEDRFSRGGVQLAKYGDTVKAMQVLAGSPAAKAGIREGDEVVSIDGKAAASWDPDDLIQFFENAPEGRKVPFEISREGKKSAVTVRLRRMI